MMDKCSIILPIFNEKKNIPILLKKIISIKKKIKNVYLDIIFVDDSSTDGSTEILKELEKKHMTWDKVIDAIDDGVPFCRDNLIKYSSRFGKKDGMSKLDALKIIHYGVLLYHFAGFNNETQKSNYETF